MEDFTCADHQKHQQGFEALPRFIRAGFIYFKKYANVRRQGFGQRMAVCELLKKKGNDLFNENDIEAATREYEQAVSIFRYIVDDEITLKSNGATPEDVKCVDFEGNDQKEKTMIQNIKAALYNNLAACYLKIEDYKNAKLACDEVLILDPKQTKALYRRAKAITSGPKVTLEEYNLGLEDLKKAYDFAPQNSVIVQALNQIKQDISRLKASTPETFKGIFVQKNDKTKSPQPNSKTDSEDYNNSSRISTQARSEDSLDMISETPLNRKKSLGDNETLNECYQTLSKSNLESPITFNQEIDRLSRILEAKRHEISETSNKSKNSTVTNALKQHLDKAMAALHRLEELASLDMANPTCSLEDAARKFGLNLNAVSLQGELKRIQAKSLEEIKFFIDELNINDNSPKQIEVAPNVKQELQDIPKIKAPIPESAKALSSKTTNNYFINNNYISEADSLYQEFSRLSERIQVVETLKDKKAKQGKGLTDEQLLADLAKGFSKLSSSGKRDKIVRIMNLVIVVVAITLLFMTIVLQTRYSEQAPQEIKEI